jgi:hypothetical protein
MNGTRLRVAAMFSLVALAAVAFAARTPAPKGAEVYFITPKDGETVTSPVTVRFGLKGMGIAPAGMQAPDTGHHHLLVNASLADMDKPIPKDEKHVHFGGGQTEASVKLPPGTHKLQLLVGDHLHIPHNPPVASKVITVSVK